MNSTFKMIVLKELKYVIASFLLIFLLTSRVNYKNYFSPQHKTDTILPRLQETGFSSEYIISLSEYKPEKQYGMPSEHGISNATPPSDTSNSHTHGIKNPVESIILFAPDSASIEPNSNSINIYARIQ